MNIYIQKSNNFEIRIKENGEMLLKVSIPYLYDSEVIYFNAKGTYIKERIAPKAFGNVLKRNNNVPKLLLDHKYNTEQKVKKFKWTDTDKSFNFEFTFEPSKELLRNINNLGAMSFGFVENGSRWLDLRTDFSKVHNWERTILSFKEFREISILINEKPAYPSARIYVGDRALPLNTQEKEEFISYMQKVIEELKRGELETIKREVNRLRG